MLTDPTCPIDVLALEYIGPNRLQVTLHSCSASTVSEIHGVILPGDILYHLTELSLKPDADMTVCLYSQGHEPQILFHRVISETETWIHDAGNLKKYPQDIIPDKAQYLYLTTSAGDKVPFAAQIDRSGDWQCICGRWNRKDSAECMRCHRLKTVVLEKYTLPAIDEALSENADALGSFQSEPFHDQQNTNPQAVPKRSTLSMIVLCLLFALLCICSALIIRSFRYSNPNAPGLMPTSYHKQAIEYRLT